MQKVIKIIIGNILTAFGLSVFLLDHHVLLGGVSGVCTVLQNLFPISLNVYVYGLTIVLFITGYVCFGKDFAFKTLVSSIVFPIAFSFFNDCSALHPMVDDIFFASIVGGALLGTGAGLILSNDGSSGGLDILALLLHKKTPVPLSYAVNGVDICVLALQVPFHTKEEVLYGICAIFVSTVVLHKILLKGTSLVQLCIISKQTEKLQHALLTVNDVGITLLDGKQGYTKQNTEVILCAIPIQKLNAVKQSVQEIDPEAFIILSDVKGVQGYRFTY